LSSTGRQSLAHQRWSTDLVSSEACIGGCEFLADEFHLPRKQLVPPESKVQLPLFFENRNHEQIEVNSRSRRSQALVVAVSLVALFLPLQCEAGGPGTADRR